MGAMMTVLKKETGQAEADPAADEQNGGSFGVSNGLVERRQKADGADAVENATETSEPVDAQCRHVVEDIPEVKRPILRTADVRASRPVDFPRLRDIDHGRADDEEPFAGE